jgi:hypothetical protein
MVVGLGWGGALFSFIVVLATPDFYSGKTIFVVVGGGTGYGAKIIWPNFKSDNRFGGEVHFGIWVDGLEKANEKVCEADRRYLADRKGRFQCYLRSEYATPGGFVFDLTENSCRGAVKT